MHQKDSHASLLDASCNKNNTVWGYTSLKNKNEEWQRNEVPFSVEILVHLNKIKEADEIL